MSDDQIVKDFNGTAIAVGCEVLFGADNEKATVYEITDYDADYNDDLQRAELYPPKVKVRFEDGTEEVGSTYHNFVMFQNDVFEFICDDLEVVTLEGEKA